MTDDGGPSALAAADPGEPSDANPDETPLRLRVGAARLPPSWARLILSIDAVTTVVVMAGVTGPVRILAVLLFASTVPGGALLALRAPAAPRLSAGLVAVLSWAWLVVANDLLVQLGWWHPFLLFALTALGAGVPLAHAARRPRPGPRVSSPGAAAGNEVEPAEPVCEVDPEEGEAQRGREPVGQAEPPQVGSKLWPADGAVAVAAAAWVTAMAGTHLEAVTSSGLVPALPVAYFVGLAALVVYGVVELRRSRPGRVRMILALGLLILYFHGTAPTLEQLPHYAWVYKHLGVVKYIDAHGSVRENVDIYQDWPGFFSVAAWLQKVGGLADPITLAHWAQLWFNAASAVCLYSITGALGLSERRRWASLLVFVLGNWVGQDYFSPQAMAFTLSLGFFAILLAWFQSPSLTRIGRWVQSRGQRLVRAGQGGTAPAPRPPPPAAVAALLGVFVAIVVTHQLTPYAILIPIALMTALGVIRPRWLVVALAVLAVVYLAPHFDFVNRRYGLVSSLGNIVQNAKTSAATPGAAPGNRAAARSATVLSLAIWSLGGLGLVRSLRRGEWVLPLAVLAASPVLILVVQNYGGEAILRVFLFSLPWSAVLASSLVETGLGRRGPGLRLATAAALAGSVVLAGLFLEAYFGSEQTNIMWRQDLAVASYFYATAPPRSTLVLAAPNMPLRDAANYPAFDYPTGDADSNLLTDDGGQRFWHQILGSASLPAIEGKLRQEMLPGTEGYLAIGEGERTYAEDFGLLPPGSLNALDQALASSPDWRPVFRDGNASLYQLVGADRSPPLVGPAYRGQAGWARQAAHGALQTRASPSAPKAG